MAVIRSVLNRTKVVGAGFGVGAVVSAFMATGGAGKMNWSPGEFLFVWASVLTGPFSGLWAAHDWGWSDALGWATVGGCAIAAHPLRFGWPTGVVSGVGVAGWVFLGLALTYDGV